MRGNNYLPFTGVSFVRYGFRLVLMNLTAALLLSLLSACTPTTEFDRGEGELDPEIAPESAPAREPSDCPALDSQLFQLLQADDPLLLAEQLEFRLQGDKVQVLLILAGEETDFLQGFGVEVGTQAGNQVQAFAPINQLCDLANADPVLAVRPAAQAFP